jgi:hypothetical protein
MDYIHLINKMSVDEFFVWWSEEFNIIIGREILYVLNDVKNPYDYLNEEIYDMISEEVRSYDRE